MTLRTFVCCAMFSAFVPAAAFAQNEPQRPPAPARPPAAQPPAPPVSPAPPTPPAPPAPSTPRTPRREGQPVNLKTEITIVDQRGSSSPTRKTVSVVVADNMVGFIRSTSNYTMVGRVESVPLNVDVEPQLVADNKIRMRLNVQYDLPNSLAQDGSDLKPGNLFTTQLRENLSFILENGKPLVVAQSADPVGDRRVTIEVMATVLK
jgi:hypothetical protein